MVLTPRYYLADMETGDVLETVRLTNVSLSSSFKPGKFSATIDLRQFGSMAAGRAFSARLRERDYTLIPANYSSEKGPNGEALSYPLGEWWVQNVQASYRGYQLRISGPEFEGYAKHVLLAQSFRGNLDPIKTVADMLRLLATTSQNMSMDLGTPTSTARIPMDIAALTTDYFSAIKSISESEAAPFEWCFRYGFHQPSGYIERIKRILEIGRPTLSRDAGGHVLELTGPGITPATVLDSEWEFDSGNNPTTIYGFGAGSGEDQIGVNPTVFTSRPRPAGQVPKNRVITVKDALTEEVLERYTRAEMGRVDPMNLALPATVPTSRLVPSIGRSYPWLNDETWTMEASEPGARVRCVGWSWKSGAQNYTLDLVRM